jgi:hypothetical protein
MKQKLNEQFTRMQKIAGIINENQINKESNSLDRMLKLLKLVLDDSHKMLADKSEDKDFIISYLQDTIKGVLNVMKDSNRTNENQINEDDIFNGQYSIGNEAYDRMDGLVNENDYDNFIRSATNIMNTLTDDGFEPKEVFYYLYTRLTVEV